MGTSAEATRCKQIKEINNSTYIYYFGNILCILFRSCGRVGGVDFERHETRILSGALQLNVIDGVVVERNDASSRRIVAIDVRHVRLDERNQTAEILDAHAVDLWLTFVKIQISIQNLHLIFFFFFYIVVVGVSFKKHEDNNKLQLTKSCTITVASMHASLILILRCKHSIVRFASRTFDFLIVERDIGLLLFFF